MQHISGSIEMDRFKIMLYMMKIVYFPNQMNLPDFPYKALVKKLYESLKDDLNNLNEKEYQLLDMPLSSVINQNFDSFQQSFVIL